VNSGVEIFQHLIVAEQILVGNARVHQIENPVLVRHPFRVRNPVVAIGVDLVRLGLDVARRLLWSVSATACIPAAATPVMSSGTRTIPSLIEYSVCTEDERTAWASQLPR